MQIVFLHGAWSSPKVFNYAIQNLKLKDNYSALKYNTEKNFDENLDSLFEQIKNYKEIFFVGHSLGGIYALHLADILDDKCKGGLTVATPYGGISSSLMFRMFYPKEPVFRYLDPMSNVVWHNEKAKHPDNWMQIVCRGSSVPWIREDNDGVVTVPSQTWLSGIKMHFANNGHHDILQDPEFVKILKERIECSMGD